MTQRDPARIREKDVQGDRDVEKLQRESKSEFLTELDSFNLVE